MITIEEMQAMLDDIAGEFPVEFFEELNGGIILLPEVKHHEKSVRDNDLYVLGDYHRGGSMGRYITIFYGSFMRVYGHLLGEKIKEKLRSTLRHEFRHHIESLAGNDDLERMDRKYIADYQSGRDYPDEDDEDGGDDDEEYDDEYDDEEYDEDEDGDNAEDEDFDNEDAYDGEDAEDEDEAEKA